MKEQKSDDLAPKSPKGEGREGGKEGEITPRLMSSSITLLPPDFCARIKNMKGIYAHFEKIKQGKGGGVAGHIHVFDAI